MVILVWRRRTGDEGLRQLRDGSLPGVETFVKGGVGVEGLKGVRRQDHLRVKVLPCQDTFRGWSSQPARASLTHAAGCALECT